MLSPLGTLTGATLRLWRLEGERYRLIAAPPGAEQPSAPRAAGADTAWLALPDHDDVFLEVVSTSDVVADEIGRRVVPVVAALFEAERTTLTLTTELAARYEEIDLLYSIGELLGRARAVEEVAAIILREVTGVVGARRAGLRLVDDTAQQLRTVAMIGVADGIVPAAVSVDDETAVIARAYRTRKIATGQQPEWVSGELLAVPIMYAAAGQPSRVVGTLSLADRAGGGSFTREETKLVSAVATQIGAALENARLVARERTQHRVEHELKLAHDLQVRLMPTPEVVRGDADIAVRTFAAESLGGDFYTFLRLGRGRVGVMLGDVSSHGFSAALIAAQVMAAAGIHSHSESTPDAMLTLLHRSLAAELESTEMYLTICYAVFDPTAGRISYSNAGHPYAFRVPRFGPASRLSPTSPPLGLAGTEFTRRVSPWHFTQDLLVAFTDGLVDQVGTNGERYGEVRLLTVVEEERLRTPEEIVDAVFHDLDEWGGEMGDDRTLLVMRM